jgi:hypothetical protein
MIEEELLKGENIKYRIVYRDIAKPGDTIRSPLIDTRNGL